MASSEDPTRIHPTAPAPPTAPPAGPGLTPHEPQFGGTGGPNDPPLPPTGGGGGGGWDDGPDEPQDDEKKRNWALFVIAGALVLIALFLGLSLLQSDDDEPTVASTPTEVVTPETTPIAPTTPRAEPVTPPAPTTPDTSNSGDDTSGGNTEPTTPADEGPLLEAGSVTKIKVSQGDTVAFRVKSDTDEEVHVHGYDQTFDVRAGQTKAISFTADLTGIFEIEFEGSATQIGELTVEP